MNRLLEALAAAQFKRPLVFALLALLMCAASMPFVLRLTLNGDLRALLPSSAPSVRDLSEIERRFGRPATFVVAVQSKNVDAMRRFTRELAPKLERLESVQSVDWNVADYQRFVESNRHLYADFDDLVSVRDAITERLDWERAHANPLYVDLLEGEEPPPEPSAVIERLREKERAALRTSERFPEGFFQHPNAEATAIFVRTSIQGSEGEPVEKLIRDVDAAVASLHAERFAPDLHVDYGGTVMDLREENRALTDAAVNATLVTIVLVTIAIFVFFLRWRAIPILAVGLIPSVLATFAFAHLTVGYLNASSAFLSSIVIGNGINPHIIWLARYFECRRDGKSVMEALAETHRATWGATLSASLAAAVAYSSLMITDFRALRDFGIIGGVGMVLCWFGMLLVLPVIAVLYDRWSPMHFKKGFDRQSNVYGNLLVRVTMGAPRTVLLASGVLTVLSVALVFIAVQAGPLEYDFRNLQSQRAGESRVMLVNRLVVDIVDETTGGSALAVLVDSRQDVAHVREQFRQYAAAHPRDIGPVRTIDDLLPTDQDRKLPVLRELREVMLEMRGFADEEQIAEIDRYLPPETLRVLGDADLPETVARPYIERDGSRGSLLYVEHEVSRNNWDGHYLILWTEVARHPSNRDGSPVAVAGFAPVFADLLDSVLEDGPKSVAASLIATIILLLFTFRTWRERWLTLASHLAGVLWMAGLMAIFQIKINFLNFVAFPITFGLGVDYGVNVMRRYVEEEQRSADAHEAVKASLSETGGAVILCSLTTIIGYIALYTSTNRSVNTFGAAMSLSEVTCVGAAVVALPALLTLIARRNRSSQPAPARPTEAE